MQRLSLDTTVDHTSAKPIVITYVGTDAKSLLFTATEDGTAIDLTSATLTLSASYKGAEKIVEGTIVKDDADDGLISYVLGAADVDEAGDYIAQIRITDGGATYYLEPFILRVEPATHNPI